MARCSVCGRRGAVYLRASSGERLCRICLERSLLKRVKRMLSRTRSIGPKDTILVPVLGLWPAKAAALLRLVSVIEREYPSVLVVLVDRRVEPCVPLLREISGGSALFYGARGVPWEEEGCGSMLGALRLSRAIAVEAARRLGAGIVMMPQARDFFVALMLSSLLRGDVGGMAEHRSHLDVGGVRVVYPLYGVECEDVAFYSHTLGLLDACPAPIRCVDEAEEAVGAMVSGLSAPGRELLFSAGRVEKLLRRATGGLAVCPYCGGLDEEAPCRVCREAGMGRLARSLEVYPLT